MDQRIDEFAAEVFKSMGFGEVLPDALVADYKVFKRYKDMLRPGQVSPEGFALLATRQLERQGGVQVSVEKEEVTEPESGALSVVPQVEAEQNDKVIVMFMGQQVAATKLAEAGDKVVVAIDGDSQKSRTLSKSLILS